MKYEKLIITLKDGNCIAIKEFEDARFHFETVDASNRRHGEHTTKSKSFNLAKFEEELHNLQELKSQYIIDKNIIEDQAKEEWTENLDIIIKKLENKYAELRIQLAELRLLKFKG